MTTKNTGNSLNSMILANIQKEKRKFYNEIKKLLNKYGFQDELWPFGIICGIDDGTAMLVYRLIRRRYH